MGRVSIDKKRILNPDKRAELLFKLMPALLTEGIKKFKTNDLLEVAEVSKRTLYQHFSSKSEIVAVTIEYVFLQIDIVCEVLKESHLAHEERFIKVMHEIVGALDLVSAQFLIDLRDEYPEINTMMNEHIHSILLDFKDFYKDAIKKKKMRKVSVETLVHMDRLFIFDLANPDNKSDRNISNELESYLDLKWNGLRPN
ncbi:hypothetical protein A9Q84_03725 [Halobacteriovorax marinus]|mgnify:CR=1 FL=1|uniref:HTH tetR-type domain-containing protein n=1 Tax=Halobacteriovorax marinus TaxID=97084 RepID=A0A1Y5FFQ1_9BACT|nr:hypothetical protein A9Q84_03725 [Halobacteriovorax marinus]